MVELLGFRTAYRVSEFAQVGPAAGRTRALATDFPAPVHPAPGGDFATGSPLRGGAGCAPLCEWRDGVSDVICIPSTPTGDCAPSLGSPWRAAHGALGRSLRNLGDPLLQNRNENTVQYFLLANIRLLCKPAQHLELVVI